jgi:hypothetical protein
VSDARAHGDVSSSHDDHLPLWSMPSSERRAVTAS